MSVNSFSGQPAIPASYGSSAGKNGIINGGMDIWQRGTSNSSFAVSNSGSYVTADRWNIGSTASVNLASSQQAADNIGSKYALRYGRVSGQTATGIVRAVNALETISSAQFAGNNVTLSFYAKKGADAPSSLTCYVYWGTGTDQSASATYSGWTGAAFNSQVNTLTTSSQRFTFSTSIPSSATQVAVLFDYTSTGTAGANEWIQLEKVQLEIGSSATLFARAGGTIQGELAACQRYYVRYGGTALYAYMNATGNAYSGTNARCMFPNPINMRTAPTSVEYSTIALYDGTTLTAITNVANSYASPTSQFLDFTVSTGLTTNRTYTVNGNNSTSAYLALSAEL